MVIQTQKLTKYYNRGKILGIKDLDLEINKGETFGFIGPNGAGKTTTIRLLLDLIRPTSGSAEIFGMDINKDSLKIRKDLGFLPGEVFLPEHLTGKQCLDFFKSFKEKVDEKYLKDLIIKLDFDLKRKVKNYSKGNKQILAIILALMHRPKLLLLDEPTSGLDPLNQQIVYKLLNQAKEEGTTIFLSTHILTEAQKVCDRVGILKEGKLMKVENIEELKNRNIRNISIETTERIPLDSLQIEGVEKVEKNKDGYHLTTIGKIGVLITKINKFDIKDVRISEPTLEETFMHYYKK